MYVHGAGFFTTQKAQETIYRGVEQSTTNVQLVGNVYGLASNTTEGIDQIRFAIPDITEIFASTWKADELFDKIIHNFRGCRTLIHSKPATGSDCSLSGIQIA